MDNVRGAILMVLAMFGFAVEDMLIKQMSTGLPVGQVVMILGIGASLIFGTIAVAYGDKLLSPASLNPRLMLRNACEMFGTFGFVAAIALTPISTASAILQATPLVVTLGAAVFLGETVGWRRWMAILIGLFGVLLIIKPGMDGFDAKSLFAVMGVVGLAGRDLVTRNIPKTISSRIIALNAFLVSILTGFLLLTAGITGSEWTPLDTRSGFSMAAAIVVGVAAYYAIIAATRIGDMSIIAPYRYSRLVFALIIGIFAFQERPDALTLLGAAIIVTSGCYTLFREARLRRTSPSGSSTL